MMHAYCIYLTLHSYLGSFSPYIKQTVTDDSLFDLQAGSQLKSYQRDCYVAFDADDSAVSDACGPDLTPNTFVYIYTS